MADMGQILRMSAETAGLRKGEKDLDRVGVAADRADDKVEKFENSVDKAGNTTAAFGKTAATAFKKVAIPLVALAGSVASLRSAIPVIKEFETNMSALAGVSGATSEELAAMRDVAKTLGSSTEFSAGQAAKGMQFLAMAGFSAKEAVASIPSVLDLATASAMGLGEAADITSNIMSGFGVSAEKASEVTDLLAAASSRANTDVSQLGGAMKYVGPVASSLGISMSDTAAAIGKLSDAGIQGSMAGTSLRNILSRLTSPTDAAKGALKDLGIAINQVNPEMVSLSDIMGTFAAKGLDAAAAMEIAGMEGGPALLALVSQTEGLKTLSNELRNVEGASSEMAATMRDNLGGDIAGLGSAAQSLALALGEAGLTAVLRGVVQTLTSITRGVTGFVNSVGNVISVIRDFGSGALHQAESQKQLEIAMDNVTLAMGDEIRQAEFLSQQLANGSIVTIEATRAKLEEARAREANIKKLVAERTEAAKASPEYQSLIQQIMQAQTALFVAKKSMADAYEGAEQNVIDLLNRQKQMLDIIHQQGDAEETLAEQTERVRANIAQLETNLANLRDGQRLINGEWVAGFGLTERIKASLSGIPGLLNAGAQSANTLSAYLLKGANAALQLASMLRQPMAMLGSVGKGLVGFSNQAKAIGGALSGLNKLGGVMLNSETWKGFAKNMSDTGKVLSIIHGSMSRIPPVQAKIASGAAAIGSASKKAGAASKAASRSTIVELRKEIAHRQTLLTLSGKEREQFEAVHALRKRLGDEAGKLSKEQIANLAGQITHLEEAEKALDRVKNLQKQWSENITRTAFEGGSLKDTIKGILRDIAYQFANTKIVLPIVGKITNVLGLDTLVSGGKTGAGPAGGSGLGGFLGNLTGGFTSGLNSVVSGLFGGGIKGAAGAIGKALGGIGTGVSGIATALGAVAGPIAAIALVAKLFKSTVTELNRGVAVMVKDGGLSFSSYRDMQKKNAFRSKYYRVSGDADPEFVSAFEQQFDAITATVQASGATLGIAADHFTGLWNGYNFDLSLAGKSAEEAQQIVSKQLGIMADDFTRYSLQKAGVQVALLDGETEAQALQRLANALTAVNDISNQLNFTLYQTSVSGGEAASKLVQLMGGLDQYVGTMGFFRDNFYSDAERLEMQQKALGKTFNDLNLILPQTRSGFRGMVEEAERGVALALQTGQGLEDAQKQFAGILNLSQAFDAHMQLLDQVEGVALAAAERITSERLGIESELLRLQGNTAELRRRELEALDPSNRALKQAVYAFQDLEAAAADWEKSVDAQVTALKAKYDNAALQAQLSTLDSQIAAAKSAAEGFLTEYSAKIDARLQSTISHLNVAKDRASDALQVLAGNLDSISSAIASRGPVGFVQEEAHYRNSQADLRRFAAGTSYSPEALERALSGVGGDTSQFFTSMSDMLRDRAATTSVLLDLEKQAAGQVTEAERQIALIEKQISAAQASAEADKVQYALQLDWMGEATSIYKSMDQALDAVAQFSARREDIQNLMAMNTANLDRELFQLERLRAETREHINATKGVSSAVRSLTEALTKGKDIPKFASGGVHTGGWRIVGENGPEAEYTPPSRIFNANQTRQMMQGGGGSNNAALLSEMRAMRAELARTNERLARIERTNRETADLTAKWEAIGQPKERTA